jgi:hypothetical protein
MFNLTVTSALNLNNSFILWKENLPVFPARIIEGNKGCRKRAPMAKALLR